MGFWWARQAFLESLHKRMTVDHCVRDSRMTPAPSVGNVHRVPEGCHGTLAAAAPLGQFAINFPATPPRRRVIPDNDRV
jgi:hypothetical protein